jgi:phosphoribulokinase
LEIKNLILEELKSLADFFDVRIGGKTIRNLVKEEVERIAREKIADGITRETIVDNVLYYLANEDNLEAILDLDLETEVDETLKFIEDNE